MLEMVLMYCVIRLMDFKQLREVKIQLLFKGPSGLIKIWDAKNLAILKSIDAGHKNRIWSITYAKNGNRLATASSDITVKVWNMVLFYIILRKLISVFQLYKVIQNQ